MLIRLLLALVITSSLSGSAQGQCSVISRWGERGFPADFTVHGDMIAAADGRGVAVYDLSNPKAIRQTGALRTNAPSLAIESTPAGEVVLTTVDVELIRIAGGAPVRLFEHPMSATTLSCDGSLCAAAGTDLTIFRVGEGAFEPVAFVPLMRPADAVLAHDGRIYVGTGGLSTSVYELTGAPITELQAAALDFAVSGNTIYAASGGGGLTVIADSASPSISARHFVAEMDLRRVIASSSAIFGVDAGSGRVLRFDLGSAPRADLVIGERPSALAIAGGELVIASAGRPIRILDAATFASIGEFEDRQGPLTGVATDGAFAYVADPPLFRVIDFRDPLNPREIASLPIEDGSNRVRLNGSMAIVYGRTNVHLIDVSDPAQPRYLGVWHSLGTAPNDAAFAGNLLIEDNRASGFHVLDISNPASPIQIGGLRNDFYGQFNAVVAQPGVAYGLVNRGVKVIDLSNPRSPQIAQFMEIPRLTTAEIAPSSATHPALLLLIDDQSVRIFDLASPLAPRELAVLGIAAPVEIAAGSDVAYVSTRSGEIARIDLSSSTPRITHVSKFSSVATQMAVAPGDAALAVADSNSVVLVRDFAAAETGVATPQLSAAVNGQIARLSWNAAPGSIYELAVSPDASFGSGTTSQLVSGGSAALDLPARTFARVRVHSGCSASEWSNVLTLEPATTALQFLSSGQRLFTRGGVPVSARVGVANRSSSPAALTLTSTNAGVNLPGSVEIAPSSTSVVDVVINPALAGSTVDLAIAGTSSVHRIEISSVAPTVDSRATGDVIVLAGVAATPGARGTIWKSDLNLYCRGPEPCPMRVAFNRYGTLEPAQSVALELRAGEGAVIRDAVLALFGVSPASGAFEIRSNNLDQILASAFTYNEAGSGRFGQRVSSARIDPADTAARSSRLHGISHNSTFRTNVGLVNASAVTQRAVMRLGASTAIIDLRPWEGVQHPIEVFFPGAAVDSDAIVAEAAPQVVIYQSQVDQRTGDGSFSIAEPIAVSSEGSRFVKTLIVAVRTPGALGTFWRSALQLANDSPSTQDLEVIFIPALDPSRAIARTVTLAHGELFEADDLLEWMSVPAELTYGSIRVESAGPFTGWSRIYNDASTGTYGQFVPLEEASPAAGLRTKAAHVTSPYALQIFPVEEDAQRRTNFGVAEVAGRGALLRMSIFDARGSYLGAHERFVAGNGSQIIFDVLAPYRGAGPLRVQVESAGDGDLRTYGSTVESSTGDAVFIPAE